MHPQANKKRLISLACLCIADTPLATRVAPPAALAHADLLRVLNQHGVSAGKGRAQHAILSTRAGEEVTCVRWR